MKRFFSIASLTSYTLLAYVPTGMVFGFLAVEIGLDWPIILAMSLFMYTGAGQLLTVSMIGLGASIFQIIPLLIFVNMRHIFYGLPFKEKMADYKGLKKFYFIFSLTDENWALLSSKKAAHFSPDDFFIVALLNQSYWVLGTIIGMSVRDITIINQLNFNFIFSALFIILSIEALMTYPPIKPLLYCAIIWPLIQWSTPQINLSLSIIAALFLILWVNRKEFKP